MKKINIVFVCFVFLFKLNEFIRVGIPAVTADKLTTIQKKEKLV